MHVISFNSFTPSIEVCFAASEELAPLTVMSVQHAALRDFPVINHMLLLDLKHDLREPYVRLICSLPADEGTRCQVKIPPLSSTSLALGQDLRKNRFHWLSSYKHLSHSDRCLGQMLSRGSQGRKRGEKRDRGREERRETESLFPFPTVDI